MKTVWIQLLQTSFAKGYGVILGVVTLAITARVLGPEGRGLVAATTTWVTAFATLGHLSLGQVMVKEASESNEEWFEKASSVMVTNTLVSSVICAIVGFILCRTINIFGEIPISLILTGLVMIPFWIFENYLSFLYIAKDDLKTYNRVQIISRTIAIGLLPFFLFVLSLGALGPLFSNLSALIFISIAGLFFFKKHGGLLKRASNLIFFRYVRNGILLHLNTFATFIFSGGDVLLLNYYKGAEQTGLYQLGAQLVAVMLIIPQSASMISYSQVSVDGPNKSWPKQKKLILSIFGFMFLFALLMYLVSDFLIPLVASSSFTGSVDIFKLQLIPMLGMSFCTMMSAQWIARGFFGKLSAISITIGLINFLGNKYLIPEYGMLGAVWANIIAFGLAFAVNLSMYFYCEFTTKRPVNVE